MREQAYKNTSFTLWRENEEDAYSPTILVTEDGKIGINVGGCVIVKDVREWHSLAANPTITYGGRLPLNPERGGCDQLSVKKPDIINEPPHYTTGGIETIDFIQAKLTPEQFKGHLMANILKYVTRHQHKNGVEDLKKARWYLDKLIEAGNG